MKYSEFCEIQQGTVIIDDNGFGYVMGDELLYPSDPNEPFSIIRFHKFDCDGFRIATEAETRKFFKDLESNGFSWDKENSTVKPIPKPFDKLLKDAAKEYAGKLEKPRLTKGKRVSRMYPSNINAFIAGAKWMAEQGLTLDGDLMIPAQLVSKDIFKSGNDVVITIRKTSPDTITDMKVFGCEMQGSYAGGIILVAADNVKQAYELASTCDKCDLLFEWVSIDKDGLEHWAEPFSEGAVLKSDHYPFEKWHEFEHLSCNYTEPQVILEESHAE